MCVNSVLFATAVFAVLFTALMYSVLFTTVVFVVLFTTVQQCLLTVVIPSPVPHSRGALQQGCLIFTCKPLGIDALPLLSFQYGVSGRGGMCVCV
jgi:hypothetical protein